MTVEEIAEIIEDPLVIQAELSLASSPCSFLRRLREHEKVKEILESVTTHDIYSALLTKFNRLLYKSINRKAANPNDSALTIYLYILFVSQRVADKYHHNYMNRNMQFIVAGGEQNHNLFWAPQVAQELLKESGMPITG